MKDNSVQLRVKTIPISVFLAAFHALLVATLSQMIASAECVGQDTVIVHADPNKSAVAHQGTILDYNALTLVLDVNGKQRTYKSSEVISVESPMQQLATEGDTFFANHQFEFAWNAYDKALKSASPAWLKRRLVAGKVKSAREMGNWDRAAGEFLRLLNGDSETRFFDHIPLVWTSIAPDQRLEDQAINWMKGRNSAATLIGCSFLLSGKQRNDAVNRLREIAREEEQNAIGQLAAAQIWRTRVTRASQDDIRSWEGFVDEIPEGLRAGPHFLVGTAWAQHNMHEMAALNFLRVPIVHSDHYGLATRSLLSAGTQLSSGESVQVSNRNAAITCFRELVNEHRGTGESDLARQKLKEFEKQ